MVKAYRWLLDQGIAPGHIALTGDSAGGCLAVTTILAARERGLPLPAATMPLSPQSRSGKFMKDCKVVAA